MIGFTASIAAVIALIVYEFVFYLDKGEVIVLVGDLFIYAVLIPLGWWGVIILALMIAGIGLRRVAEMIVPSLKWKGEEATRKLLNDGKWWHKRVI